MTGACENCIRYAFDEESGCYFCDCDLDEDEYGKFLSAKTENCPYFESNDEYSIVRKQN